jgi:hypothetical protein
MLDTAERPVAKRKDVTVKIDADVIHTAKIVAAYEGKTLAEFLSDVLAPIMDDKLAEHQKVGSRPRLTKGKGGSK